MLGALGCAPDPAHLPWPELAGARTLILGGYQAGDVRHQVVPLEPPPLALEPHFAFEHGRPGTLYAFTYPAEPEALGLIAGPYSNPSQGRLLGPSLPVASAEFDGEGLSPWAPPPEPPPENVTPRRAESDGCARFTPLAVTVDVGRPTLALPLPAGALIGGLQGLAVLDPAAGVAATLDAPDGGFRAAAMSDDGLPYVLGRDHLYRVLFEPLRVTEVASATTSVYGFDWLVVGRSVPLEAFALDRDGLLARASRGRLEIVARFTTQGDDRYGLARLGLDDVVAVFHDVSFVHRWAQGERIEVQPPALVPGFDTAYSDAGTVVLAAQFTGDLTRYDGKTFQPLPGMGIGGNRRLVPYRGRYLALGNTGQLTDYQAGQACGDAAERRFSDLYVGIPFGDGVLIGGLGPDGRYHWDRLTPR